MNKNTLFMLMAAVLLLLSACTSQGNGAESKAANAEKTKQSETPKQPVSLVFYNVGGNFNAEGYFEEKFGKFIKEKFPHVTPQFIPTTAGNLTKLIASDQQPDIIFGSVGLTYANVFANNLQYDLDPLVKKYKLDLKRFEPKSLEMIRQMSDGKLYGLPFDNQASVIYYNKDLFDKFGVPYPKNGITWDELYDLSVKLTRKDGGVQYYGFTMSPGHYFLRNQLSLNLVDPKTLQINLANDNVKTLLNNITRFYEIPGFDVDKTKLTIAGQTNLFFKDKVSAMWTPISGLHVAAQLEGMNWDIVSVPSLKQATGIAPQPYPTFLYLNVASKNKDEAFEVMEYLTSEEFLEGKGKSADFIPAIESEKVRKSFGQDAALYKGRNVSAIPLKNMAAPSPQSKYYSAATTLLGNNVMQAILVDRKDINTALREAEEALRKTIDDDQKK